ncbi:phage tail assembly protein [Thiohalophilus sp.]|uniref:phage tail assembly protein n=1 Tax=Thiohalophilus sp. TaxID=3028392 RepID=UPI002ACD4046|nr:phage tail assembly protein [Thiohalophilus sp.]MDZ7804340.1 phage tail assembly protein [Thiohalophilus sp.]
MATSEFDLKHGLQVGDDVLKHVVLRELTAGDIIDCQAESERLVYSQGKPVLVSSPAVAGIAMLCRQVEKIGDINGPLETALLRKLHEEDFLLIQEKATELSVAAYEAAQEIDERGRPDDDGARD